jgi:mono/diheme cytochrome c family protein
MDERTKKQERARSVERATLAVVMAFVPHVLRAARSPAARVSAFLFATALGLSAAASAVSSRKADGPAAPVPSDDDYLLERARVLPAPGPAAIAYEVREPLRNGDTVPVKKRWLEVPSGRPIVLTRKHDGQWEPSVPAGTKLWKEFWLDDGRGVGLVERRLTLKVDPARARAVGHDDAWIFVSAFETPHGEPSHSPSGWASVGPDEEGAPPTRLASPLASLPIQRAAGPLEVFAHDHDAQGRYVFPGSTACATCHGGATAGFRDATGAPTLAFGIHPDNLTAVSLERLVAAGAVRLGEATTERTIATAEVGARGAVDRASDDVHARFLAILRNNCVSCHNPDPLAAARTTAFVLDPDVRYTRAELLERLGSARAMRHAGALPLVSPGSPEKSELVLRMTGHEGRRRMPPVEGGVPAVDEELVELTSRWIRGDTR